MTHASWATPSAAATGAPVPDAAGYIFGYRELRLGSVMYGEIWPIGEPLGARCRRARHPAPDPACGCGIHAVSLTAPLGLEPPTLAAARAALARADLSVVPFDQGPVGVVRGWGLVAEEEMGWRAEWAEPVALFLPAPDQVVTGALVERLARLYRLETLPA